MSERVLALNSDVPIETPKQDRLDRVSYAQSLGRILAGYDRPDSLVVGLYGEWGSGKSSLINLALNFAAKCAPAPIVVRFNPWYFSGREDLTQQLFRQMSAALALKAPAKNYKRAAFLLDKLSKALDPLAAIHPITVAPRLFLSLLAKRFSTRSKETDSLDSIKDGVSHALAAENRRVVVVMDDVDRLTGNEIRTIFQLVKAVGDFSNTTYLLAFDDRVVVRALDRVQDGDGEGYLDKIINVAIRVPSISPASAIRLTLDTLNSFAAAHMECDWGDERRALTLVTFLTRNARTIRQLNRLTNALHADITSIRGEVDAYDFAGITALRALRPALYAFARENRDLLIETPVVYANREKSDATARTSLETLMGTERQREETQALLGDLFPRVRRIFGENRQFSDREEVQWRRARRICDPDSFDVYFQFSVSSQDVSRSRMEAILRDPNENNLRTSLAGFLDEGLDKAISFLERLKDHIEDPRVQSDARAVVATLVDMGDLFPQDIRGFPFRLDGGTLIYQIVYQLLGRIDDHRARYQILQHAIKGATQSLFPLVKIVSGEESAHANARDAGTGKAKDRRLVSDDELGLLQDQAREQIEKWSEGDGGGRLAEHERLGYILYRWSAWSGRDAVEPYVLRRLDSVNFARLMLALAENGGNHLTSAPTLWHDSVRRLFDPERAMGRILTILMGSERRSLRPEVVERLERLPKAAGS